MVKCPRCETMVDETTRTTCPICFTPVGPQPLTPQQSPSLQAPVLSYPTPNLQPPTLSPAANNGYTPPPGSPQAPAASPQTAPHPPYLQRPPAYPQGVPPPPVYTPPAGHPPAQPGARVSLTGEVLYDSTPLPPQQPGHTPGGVPAAPPYPGPSAALRPVYVAPSRSKTPPVVLIATIVVILVGIGGKWAMGRLSNPKDVVQKYLAAFKADDWQAIFNLSEVPRADRDRFPTAQALENEIKDAFRKYPNGEQILKEALASMSNIQIGEPTYKGVDGATIHVAYTFSGKGGALNVAQDLTLQNTWGTWKVTSAPLPFGGFGGMRSGLGNSPGFGSIPNFNPIPGSMGGMTPGVGVPPNGMNGGASGMNPGMGSAAPGFGGTPGSIGPPQGFGSPGGMPTGPIGPPQRFGPPQGFGPRGGLGGGIPRGPFGPPQGFGSPGRFGPPNRFGPPGGFGAPNGMPGGPAGPTGSPQGEGAPNGTDSPPPDTGGASTGDSAGTSEGGN